jgi:hypothetical protein
MAFVAEPDKSVIVIVGSHFHQTLNLKLPE